MDPVNTSALHQGQWEGFSAYFNPEIQPGYNYLTNNYCQTSLYPSVEYESQMNKYPATDAHFKPSDTSLVGGSSQTSSCGYYNRDYPVYPNNMYTYQMTQNNCQQSYANTHSYLSSEKPNAASSRPHPYPTEVAHVPTQPLTHSNSKGKVRELKLAKPPYSYIALVCMAIAESPSKKPTLKEIIKFIEGHFPYYQSNKKWHGSIRHNLTLNDCFVKLPRSSGEKCCRWTINPQFEDMFDNGSLRRRRYRYKEGSSNWKKSQLEVVAKQMHRQAKMESTLKQAIRNTSSTVSNQKASLTLQAASLCPSTHTHANVLPDAHNISNNSSDTSSLLDPLSPVTSASSTTTPDGSFVFDTQSLDEFSAMLDGDIFPLVHTL